MLIIVSDWSNYVFIDALQTVSDILYTNSKF